MARGSPTRAAMDVAAIASVLQTTAPSTRPSRQSKLSGSRYSLATATPSTVKPTSPNASSSTVTR